MQTDERNAIEFALTAQQWHLIHSVLDGSMLSAGIPVTDADGAVYDSCVDHINEMRAEEDNIITLHESIARIVRAIENSQKIDIVVIPF